jgi:hypothetical protein
LSEKKKIVNESKKQKILFKTEARSIQQNDCGSKKLNRVKIARAGSEYSAREKQKIKIENKNKSREASF